MVTGVRPRVVRGAPTAGIAQSPVRPELLKVKSDGQRLSFGVAVRGYGYHDLLLRREGDAELLVGSERGWVALPARPGETIELFIRFPAHEKAPRVARLETYRARIRCPESGAVKTLAEMGAVFELYHRPL